MTGHDYRGEIRGVLAEARRKLDAVEYAALVDWLAEFVEDEAGGDSDVDDPPPWDDPDALEG